MAFENIGIGGVLSFDSKGAVTNMSMAERGFASLGRAASGARAGVAQIGAGLSQFSLLGGLGVAGLVMGFKSLVHEGMEWNAYVESTKISIGTIMAAVTKTPLAQNIAQADKILQHLNIVATQTHVETSEVVDTFSRLVGPLMGAGASMNDIYDFTKGTTILASALHQPVNRASHAMSLLAGGTLMAREQTIQLLHSMGLLHETSQEWAAYLPEKRLARMKEIMSTFAASGEYLQHTWAAQSSSAKSFFKIMAGAFTKGMFSQGTSLLERFNNAFIANQDAWLAKLEQIGQVFSKVISFMGNEVKLFYNNIQRAIKYIEAKVNHLGLAFDSGPLKVVGHLLAQFMLMVTTMSPIIAVVGFIGSKIAALASIASGLLTIIGAIAAPLAVVAAIAGALFLLFRHDGEGVADFFMRAFGAVKEFILGLWDGIKAVMDTLEAGWDRLKASGQAFWAGIQPGLADFREGLIGIVNLFQTVWDAAMPILARIWDGFTKFIEAIRPGVEVVFNGIMKVFRVLVDGLNYLAPKIMSVLGPVVDVVMTIAEKVGELLGKIFSALQPIFDAVAYILQEVIFPVAGWLIDTFGPVFVAAWKAVGWILGKIMDALGWIVDGIKWLIEGVGGALKWAFEGIKSVLSFIGDIIQKYIVEPIKWVVDKLTWVVDKVKGAASAVADFASSAASSLYDFAIGGSTSYLIDTLKKVKAEAEGTKQTTLTWVDLVQQQLFMLKLQALGVNGVIKLIADEMAEMYNQYAKPIVDAGIQILNAFTGHADIKTQKPDMNVDVNIQNNATMCVNGRNLAVAQSQYETEVAERSGFNKTPWQTQRVQISGVKP